LHHKLLRKLIERILYNTVLTLALPSLIMKTCVLQIICLVLYLLALQHPCTALHQSYQITVVQIIDNSGNNNINRNMAITLISPILSHTLVKCRIIQTMFLKQEVIRLRIQMYFQTQQVEVVTIQITEPRPSNNKHHNIQRKLLIHHKKVQSYKILFLQPT